MTSASPFSTSSHGFAASARDVPTIPLYIQPNVDIWNKKFRGFQLLEYGGSTLFSLEKVWQETP